MSANFAFKQFTINQAKAGFKVGTDACLLGSWVDVSNATSIVDVGTGTGVIALMLAQRAPLASITGVERENESAEQAAENLAQSPWSDRVSVVNADIQSYAKNHTSKFDLVVSNPPFFNDSTKNKNKRTIEARHDDALPIKELLEAAFSLTSANGMLGLVYPYHRFEELLQEANAQDWYPKRVLQIRPRVHKEVNRVLMEFSKRKARWSNEELLLYNEQANYTQGAIELLKPFYLKL